MKYDICCVGHITLDKIVTPTSEVYMAGGTAFYFSHVMACLNHSGYLLITSLGKNELESAEAFKRMGLNVEVIPSRNTVYFENIYGDDFNNRVQKVLAKADSFLPESLNNIDSKIFHLGTLLSDDFSPETLKMLSLKGIVSVDAQGFLREVKGQDVLACDWKEKLECLPYINILKANEHEMLSLTGSDNPETAAKILSEWGVKEVILTLGDKGSVIFSDGNLTQIPALPVDKVVDATGCGDTYMAGYLYMRSSGKDIYTSGLFAAAICSVKLAHSGPFNGSEDQIKKLLKDSGFKINI